MADDRVEGLVAPRPSGLPRGRGDRTVCRNSERGCPQLPVPTGAGTWRRLRFSSADGVTITSFFVDGAITARFTADKLVAKRPAKSNVVRLSKTTWPPKKGRNDWQQLLRLIAHDSEKVRSSRSLSR